MITEAQIFLTRKCNLNCGYCKLVENKKLKDLSLEEWVKAYSIMEKLGIKTVKLMGGEPTVKKWLPELLKKATIKTAILSNSVFNEKTKNEIANAVPYGYFASVDSLSSLNEFKDPVKKSISGYAMLKSLKDSKIPILAANVVINKYNYKEVPEIAQRLSDEGFYVNLCMVQHTNNSDKEFSKTNIKKSYIFTNEDKEELKKLSKKLLKMKRRGVKISVPESYIKNMVKFGIHCNWKCKRPSQLRIDADGGLMLCNEYRTRLANDYNILDMTKSKYKDFLKQWKKVRKQVDCDGCYWSCFIQSEDNLKNKKLEFHYA